MRTTRRRRLRANTFNASYTKLQRIPKDFLRSWLPDVLPKPNKLDDKTLKKLARNEPGSLRQVHYVACKVLPTTRWPKLCLERDVFRETFKRCHHQNGKLLTTFVFKDEEDDEHIKVNWSGWGVYVAVPVENGILGKLRHVVTKRAADISDLAIPSDNFVISQNWEPFKAVIKWKRQTQNLFELFPRGAQRKIKEEMRREDLTVLSATVKSELGSKGDGDDGEGDGATNAASSIAPRRRQAASGNSDFATPPTKLKRRKISRKGP